VKLILLNGQTGGAIGDFQGGLIRASNDKQQVPVRGLAYVLRDNRASAPLPVASISVKVFEHGVHYCLQLVTSVSCFQCVLFSVL